MRIELITVILFFVANNIFSQSLNNTKIDGYRPIWFELNQKYEYGDKYSGALGTYTAKHIPLAIYCEKADKTFFVFGGTTEENERHLLCMIGEYNHKTGMVSKPTVVCDKMGVDDPHDNPSILIDDEDFIWVFVSGRGKTRPGFKFKSTNPLSIDKFEKITEEEMTYPQPWNTGRGYFHFFTKYTGIRQLYFETSSDGLNWTEDKLLAAIPVREGEKSGHYQVSHCFKNNKVATFFNRHPNGNVDKRTDLYYIESSDIGQTWNTAGGKILQLPLVDLDSPARIIDYVSQGNNLYLKDMDFDKEGNPICLYIRSRGHMPGPASVPYEWCITRWEGDYWHTSVVTESDHNYDMGSLFITEDKWRIVAPTETGSQEWGVGGELAIWSSIDNGKNWEKEKQLTNNSKLSHSYVRKSLNYRAPFCFFWANGHSHEFSKSELYFGDFEGNIRKLPYTMNKDHEKPEKVEY